MAWFVDIHSHQGFVAGVVVDVVPPASVPVVPAFLWAVATSGLMPHRHGLSGLRIDE